MYLSYDSYPSKHLWWISKTFNRLSNMFSYSLLWLLTSSWNIHKFNQWEKRTYYFYMYSKKGAILVRPSNTNVSVTLTTVPSMSHTHHRTWMASKQTLTSRPKGSLKPFLEAHNHHQPDEEEYHYVNKPDKMGNSMPSLQEPAALKALAKSLTKRSCNST